MRLLEPFRFSAFTLKNRAVLAAPEEPVAAWRGMAPLRNGHRGAGLVVCASLPVGVSGKSSASLARQGIEEIHAWGGLAVARLTHENPGKAVRAAGTVIEAFADAAARALPEGFDAVEIDALTGLTAQGHDGASRIDVLLGVVEAVAAIWGIGRVGLRLSPRMAAPGHPADKPFAQAAAELDQLGIAWLHLVEPGHRRRSALDQLRRYFGGAIIAGGGHTLDSAEVLIAQGLADCVALGADSLVGHAFSSRPAAAIDFGACGH
jgi:N-ethylmaleimide reductase